MSQELIVQRTLKASTNRVFEALSDAKIMTQWFFAHPGWSANVENKFEVGGSFAINMKSPEGDVYPHTGEYREIVPNKKIVFTWNSLAVKDTLVTISLKSLEDQTEVTLKHEFITDPEVYASHENGWECVLSNLDDIF